MTVLQSLLKTCLDCCCGLQFMLKCAMARLPNQPYLLTLYSNFIIEVRHEDACGAAAHLPST
jgi:hypothetical protein